MDKYLETFYKIEPNECCKDCLPILKKIEKFLLGNISFNELLKNADEKTKKVIIHVINKVINYTNKEVSYYVPLPSDEDFNIGIKHSILAGKVDKLEVYSNRILLQGPVQILNSKKVIYDNLYAEVTGDFDNCKNGLILTEADWYKIIAKYPYLNRRMQMLKLEDETTRLFKKSCELADTEISLHMEPYLEASTENQELIDSIEFIEKFSHLKHLDLENHSYDSFEDIIYGKQKTYVSQIPS